jgi:hypothetical protein
MPDHFTPGQRDIITGARREFRHLLKRWGNYLEKGEWVTTDRIIGGYNPSNPSDHYIGSSKEGSAEFSRLENGHLKATLYMPLVTDKTPLKMEFIVALDPYDRTFIGIGGIVDGAKSTVGTATGSFDPKQGVLNWNDMGPGVGSLDGSTLIRTWGFVDIG